MEQDLRSKLKIKVEGGITLEGELVIPAKPKGLVIFSHGSGSSRLSPRNNFVALHLQKCGLGTFLFDLLTEAEEAIYSQRFNIDLLSDRLEHTTLSLLKLPQIKGLALGYFGASTGAASALTAASVLQNKIRAIVSRGGRPDLAMDRLYLIQAPVLFIVGGLDKEVLELNRKAYEKCTGSRHLQVIDGASHLFEEPGTLEQVAKISGEWFLKYLTVKEPAKGMETSASHS
jgi:putative phosphoribosyl transferase